MFCMNIMEKYLTIVSEIIIIETKSHKLCETNNESGN